MADNAASPKDFLAVAKALVEAKADLHTKNNAGHTPFHLACASGDLNMVKFLFECGSDPNTVDNQGTTPLHAAVQSGDADLLSYLLTEVGAKTGIVGAESLTPKGDPEGVAEISKSVAAVG